MATLSTHVLDTATGRPAAGVGVRLESRRDARSGPIVDLYSQALHQPTALLGCAFCSGPCGLDLNQLLVDLVELGAQLDRFVLPRRR